jgi:hypothetical protein
VSIWTSAVIPGNRKFSPILGPVTEKLPPDGFSMFDDVVQTVPSGLDEGFTRYYINIGKEYPVEDMDASILIFKSGD